MKFIKKIDSLLALHLRGFSSYSTFAAQGEAKAYLMWWSAAQGPLREPNFYPSFLPSRVNKSCHLQKFSDDSELLCETAARTGSPLWYNVFR